MRLDSSACNSRTHLILFVVIPCEKTLVVFTVLIEATPSVGHLIEKFPDRGEEQNLLVAEKSYYKKSYYYNSHKTEIYRAVTIVGIKEHIVALIK